MNPIEESFSTCEFPSLKSQNVIADPIIVKAYLRRHAHVLRQNEDPVSKF
jgi:hypothetical protein